MIIMLLNMIMLFLTNTEFLVVFLKVGQNVDGIIRQNIFYNGLQRMYKPLPFLLKDMEINKWNFLVPCGGVHLVGARNKF